MASVWLLAHTSLASCFPQVKAAYLISFSNATVPSFLTIIVALLWTQDPHLKDGLPKCLTESATLGVFGPLTCHKDRVWHVTRASLSYGWVGGDGGRRSGNRFEVCVNLWAQWEEAGQTGGQWH